MAGKRLAVHHLRLSLRPVYIGNETRLAKGTIAAIAATHMAILAIVSGCGPKGASQGVLTSPARPTNAMTMKTYATNSQGKCSCIRLHRHGICRAGGRCEYPL